MTWQERNEWAMNKGYRNMHHYRIENHIGYCDREKARLKKQNSSEKSKIRYKEKRKKATEEISDSYIKRDCLKISATVKLPSEFLELYRNNLKLKRILKNGK